MPAAGMVGYERFSTEAEKAAAYCWFIIRNHPFVDGNKRTGLAAACVFLTINGCVPAFESDEAYELITRIASGGADIEEVTAFFEKAARKWPVESGG